MHEPDDDVDRNDLVGPGRLLEADDIARYIGMTTDWIYREVRAGRMPHIRLGRYVRFRRESIVPGSLHESAGRRRSGPGRGDRVDMAETQWGSDNDTASSSGSRMTSYSL